METAIRNYLDEHSPDYVCVRMLYKEALNHFGYENPAQWECNAISNIMNHISEYKKISTHRFSEYGTQKAWVRIKEPEFKDIPEGMEKEVLFFRNP